VWKNNALVLFLSAVFKGNEKYERWRKRLLTDKITAWPIHRCFSDEAVKLIRIPTVTATYNDEIIIWTEETR
jgi:hypothetical protein